MSDATKPPSPAAPNPSTQAAPEQKAPTPQERLKKLEDEVAELEKKFGTFSLDSVNQLKTQNTEYESLKKRITVIQAKLYLVHSTAFQASDVNRQLTDLKEAAVAFFTQMKVNPDQWKNLGS